MAAKKAAIKNKSTGGKYQFGAEHSATPLLVLATMGSDPEGNTLMGLATLNGYYNNLAAAATNENSVLEELITNLITLTTLTTLTTSNAEMSDTTKKLTGDN